MYKISIIIPVFNVEEYIEDAFNSLLNQSIGFENLEVIFVDDASTDSSSQIIDEYSNKYDNVISIHLENNSGDAGRPRNVGMDNATADYLMFLDPDDVFTINACEILYGEITGDDLDIVGGVHCNGVEVPKFIWINTLTDPNDSWSSRNKKVKEMVKDSTFSLKLNSIDDYPSVIANSNIWNKIFRKSFLENNNIRSPEGMPAQDSVFLLNAFLNANGIKFINKVILKYTPHREGSMGSQFSKKRILNRLDAYYKMYYLCESKNKSDIFKHYLLFDKLKYFTNNHLMVCDLPTGDIIEILKYANPLFKLYVDYNDNIKGNFSQLFKSIANKDYENVIRSIYGEDTINQNDIKIVAVGNFQNNIFKSESNIINTSFKDCINELYIQEPNLFLYNYSKNNFDVDLLNQILKYCNENNILTIFFNNESSKFNISLEFNYIFSSFKDDILYYVEQGHENVFYFNRDDFLINIMELSEKNELYYELLNQELLGYILKKINFKYIPIFSHIFLCYYLYDLNNLKDIYNHFSSVGYHFKHVKLISSNIHSFLSDYMLKKDYDEIKNNKNSHVLFIDLK